MTPIRICIGTEDKMEIPCKVLQHSIVSRTKSEVQFFLSNNKSWYTEKQRPFQLGTAFSLYRWFIPELFGYEGYAIYLDADQIVLADILELWKSDQLYPNEETSVWCTYQNLKHETSVMFLNCLKAKDQFPSRSTILTELEVDSQREYYRRLMGGAVLKVKPQDIPIFWNHLNFYDKHLTCLIHYTVEHQQPWYKPSHPLTTIWETELVKTLEAGLITRSDIRHFVQKWDEVIDGKKVRYSGLHPYYKKYC